MSENFVGVRLHPKKDADIIADLGRFTDKTKRIKEVYRLAMQVQRGEYIRFQNDTGSGSVTSKPLEPLKWELPKEAPKATSKPSKASVLANIKSGF